MLTDKEISALNNCVLDNHILLEVERYFISTESVSIRDRLNGGELCHNQTQPIQHSMLSVIWMPSLSG